MDTKMILENQLAIMRMLIALSEVARTGATVREPILERIKETERCISEWGMRIGGAA